MTQLSSSSHSHSPARAAPKSRRPAASKPSRRRAATPLHELVVVGRGRRAHAIQRRLERLRARVQRFPDTPRARASLGPTTSAVVLVAPLPEQPLADAVEEVTRDGTWPLFVIVPEDYSGRRARSLYEMGAMAVFCWPREAQVLPAVLTDLLRVSPRRGNKTADARLARAVRSRLRLVEDSKVYASVVGGVVSLRGSVASYWRKTRLVDTLSQIPGVRSVHCERVQIVPVRRPDARLRADVRAVIDGVAGADAGRLELAVEDGIVLLAGTVSRHGELERLLDVVGNVEGVCGIQSTVVVSTNTQRARGLSTRLRKRIETMFPGARARVTVFGYIAILDGHVSTLRDKRGIAELARDTPGIGRVVDKLTVS